MAVKERKYDIVDGPNKGRLFAACALAHDKTAMITVEFKVASRYERKNSKLVCILMAISDVRITGIDNAGPDDLVLRGRCEAGLQSARTTNPYEFEAEYNHKKHRGKIRFMKR